MPHFFHEVRVVTKMDATAKAPFLHEVDIHASFEPNKPAGLVDSHGDRLTSTRPGIIERMDDKVTKEIRITQGTAMLLGAAVIILNLIFSYGGSLWTKSADDSAVKTRLEAVEKAVSQQSVEGQRDREKISDTLEKLSNKFDGIQKEFNQQAIKDAERRGFAMRQEAEKP